MRRTIACLLLVGCIEPLPPVPEVDESEMAVGETRRVELRFLRFDVTNFEQTLTREDILAFPQETQDRLWLLDLDLRSGPTTPRLLDNALEAIRDLDPEELTPAARNMQALLKMTPDTANLEGTKLEELLALAPLLGLSPSKVLADLLGTDVEDEMLSPAQVSATVLQNVIATHPNAQQRLGPRTEENPEGVYPVTPGTLPLTLADAATDFGSLSERYGPVFVDGVYHPGFIAGDARARVLGEDFALTVRANANALPYKGVDLSSASEASVNSIRSQIESLFDFDDPGWMTIEGLIEGEPVIEELTFVVVEDDRFHFGGRSPVPEGVGSSAGWSLPPYTLERILLDGARGEFAEQNATVSYVQPGREDPLFLATVEDGWQRIDVAGGVGSPPAPSYLWDLILEIGQVRLHDGGIPEGEANVEFTLRDVPVGTDTSVIERTMRENLASDPRALLDVANELIDTTRGEADFYYVRDEGEEESDWLFFVDEDDIPLADDGLPVREYLYEEAGFFGDEGLSERRSTREEVAGDTVHEKVRIEVGDVVFAPGTAGTVYRIEVREKPGRSRVALEITRVR